MFSRAKIVSVLACWMLTCLVAPPRLASCADEAGKAPDANANVPGPVRLVLPPTIYAVVGKEMNVYFDNVTLILNPANYAFDVTCPKGRQQSERWTYVAEDEDIGEHPFELVVRNEQNELVARGRSKLKVVAETKGGDEGASPRSVLMVGDSLTHASIYPARVVELFQNAGQELRLIGSHQPQGQPEAIRHEGYGGWTAKRFATHYKETARRGDYKDRGSPFLFGQGSDQPQLDFKRYCQEVNEGRIPDVVTIFLGPNDIFSATDETIEATIDDMLSHYDRLMQMVRQAAPQTRPAAMLPVPPAASQDAFGANYAAGQTRWQYKRNQHRLVERMLASFAEREAEGIYLVPTYINLDCLRNYPFEPVQADAAGEAVRRQNNGVHPSAAGYRQVGDSLYAWLRATP